MNQVTSPQINALSEFKIIEKPIDLPQFRSKRKYLKLAIALKNLANDKCIVLDKKVIECSLPSFKTGLAHICKKMFQIKIGIVEQNGQYYVFTRSSN